MQVLEVMKRDFDYVSPKDNIHTAARKMRERGIGFLPVCDQNGKPVGAITDRDIAVRVAADDRRPSNVSVREAMSVDTVTCAENADFHDAEAAMARNHKGRLMCINDQGQLVGVISLSDVAEREQDQQLAMQTLREVASREYRATVV